MSTLFPLILRQATPDDAPRLIEVGTAAYLDFLSDIPEFAGATPDLARDNVAKWVSEATPDIVLGERNDTVLGWTKTNPNSGEIGDLWVDPANQKNGVGALLLAAAEAQAKAAGHSCTWLTSHAQKNATLRFYRAHGYALLAIQDAHAGIAPEVTYKQALLGKQLSRPNAAMAASMADVRAGIDTLDPMLVSLVAERFAFIDRAADLKPAVAMPARVNDRVEEVVANARAAAQGIGFDADLTEKLWRTMVELAIVHEEATMGPDEALTQDESAA